MALGTRVYSESKLLCYFDAIIVMDVLLNGLSISAKGELQSLCCMMGKTMSLGYHFLAANNWRLID